jgi:transposase
MATSISESTSSKDASESPLRLAINCYYANRDTPVEILYPRANAPPTKRITQGWSIRQVAKMYQISYSQLHRALIRDAKAVPEDPEAQLQADPREQDETEQRNGVSTRPKSITRRDAGDDSSLQQAINCYYANRETPVEKLYPRANASPAKRITQGWSIRQVAKMYQIPYSQLQRTVVARDGEVLSPKAVLEDVPEAQLQLPADIRDQNENERNEVTPSSKATSREDAGDSPLQQAINCYYANRETPVERFFPRPNASPTKRIIHGWSIRRVAKMYQISYSQLHRALIRDAKARLEDPEAQLRAELRDQDEMEQQRNETNPRGHPLSDLRKLAAMPEVRGGTSSVRELATLALQQEAELAVVKQQLQKALSTQKPAKGRRNVLSRARNVPRRSLLDIRHARHYAEGGGRTAKQKKKKEPEGKEVEPVSDEDTVRSNDNEVEREVEELMMVVEGEAEEEAHAQEPEDLGVDEEAIPEAESSSAAALKWGGQLLL